MTQLGKSLIFLTILFLSLFLFSSSTYAKKVVPQAKSTATATASSTTKGVTIKVKLRADRKAITATFTNLSIASRVDYTLSYNTRDTTQGASGSIIPPVSEPVVREIIFGTCSHGVCRYDTGITNTKFSVTTTLKNGKKVVKTFKIIV